jgi:arsenate reductase-like glutaredoxin family protein
MAPKIVLFTMPSCPSCRAERAWLTQRGLAFSEYDLSDVDVQEELRNLEKRVQRRLEHTPITVVNGKVYEGFDPNAFEQILAPEEGED